MTIPRRLGPETGPRTALPDYSRSSATVERMVAALDPSRTGRDRGRVRALLPAHATRDTAARAVVAAALLGTALVSVLGMVLLSTVPDGRSPGLGLLVVVGALGALALLLGLLGVRFGIVALGTARARVEISADGLRVVGPVRHRDVAWERIAAIESRVVHPVHWLTAALRLEDGSRIVMPAFDRPVWACTRPSGQDIRALRTELHRRRQAGPGRR
ncbi:PH domain-containing protein [Brachybacterium paraconglomeratum]|uniref:PH domain-containing protein n=1 Tax=Brachybacterium paraconglomeratum TaxID=173362 RepID=UPI0037C687A6